MSIAVTTLGQSWQIIPELIGLLNPQDYDFFKNHHDTEHINKIRNEYDLHAVELWIICTDDSKIIKSVKNWAASVNLKIILKFFITEGIHDLFLPQECRIMRDAVLRTCLSARDQVGRDESIIFSLTGGRKTMSADMQYASAFFGPGVLLHIADKSIPDEFRNDEVDLMKPVSPEIANSFMPIVIGKYPENNLSFRILPKNYPIPSETDKHIFHLPASEKLADKIEDELSSASNLFFHRLYDDQYKQKETSNYSGIFILSPEIIDLLRSSKFGIDTSKTDRELEFIRKLPKTDLHCHLGGVLSVEEMITVAEQHKKEIDGFIRKESKFREKTNDLQKAVYKKDITKLKELIVKERINEIRENTNVPEPYGMCAFLLLFKDHPSLLDEIVYGQYLDSNEFIKIELKPYLNLGDLQGSALLQSEKTISATVSILLKKYIKENVRYLELRCSPQNYTKGGLTAIQVYNIITDEIKKHRNEIKVGIILIATRHKSEEELATIKKFINQLYENDNTEYLFGVDLAGDEKALNPKKVRDHFLPFMEKCLSITIHAGEESPSSNIWEAVYHLNAERVGHGLTLDNNSELVRKFIDRGISLEMCPSSNIQIVGYQDNLIRKSSRLAPYPLKRFLDVNLKVTVNTDNPGISRTSPSSELHRAARMTPGGLSGMDLLQILKNGFSSAFTEYLTRKQLIISSEQELIELFKEKEAIYCLKECSV